MASNMKIDAIPEQRIAEFITKWNSVRYLGESGDTNRSIFATTWKTRKMVLKTRRVSNSKENTCFLLGLLRSTYIPTIFIIIPIVAATGIIPPYMIKSRVMRADTSSEPFSGFNRDEFQDLTMPKSSSSFCAVLRIRFSGWYGPDLFEELWIASVSLILPELTAENRFLLRNISRMLPMFLFLVAIFNLEKTFSDAQTFAVLIYPSINASNSPL